VPLLLLLLLLLLRSFHMLVHQNISLMYPELVIGEQVCSSFSFEVYNVVPSYSFPVVVWDTLFDI
jgi:hypothetical protein